MVRGISVGMNMGGRGGIDPGTGPQLAWPRGPLKGPDQTPQMVQGAPRLARKGAPPRAEYTVKLCSRQYSTVVKMN
jgi:hypothetical protein